MALMVKNQPANVEDVRAASSISGRVRSPGGGHGNPLQYFHLENPMDRGAWRAAVHGVSKCWTQLKQLSTHTRITYYRSFQVKKLRLRVAKRLYIKLWILNIKIMNYNYELQFIILGSDKEF